MEFKEFQLKDLLDIQWGDTNTTKSSYVDEGYLAYSASGPDGFLDHFDYDADGVVLSAIGANCGTTYMAKGKWSCIKNTIRFLPKNNQIDIKYFYYLSKRSNFFPLRGSAQPFISQTDIRDLYVDIPEVKYQQFIGKILDEIEQKINVNNQISQTLESIAQSIFKSWFIDFDPVHAKSRGEKPIGMDDETAALFPDSFEDSELGMIPKGWAKGLLGDHVSPKKGKSITKKSTRPGEIPVVAGGLEPAYFHDTSNSKYPSVTISASGANAGFVRLYLNDIWASDCSVLNSENTRHPYFWYLLLKHNQELIYSMQQGAAQPHIYPSDLMRMPTVIASRELLDKFEKFTTTIFMLVRNNELNSLSLSEIRDLLLPRLISGDLQIPEEFLVS